MARKRSTVEFSEKEFYLDEFRGRTLLFAVHHDGPPDALAALGAVARDLLANDTRVLVLLGGRAAVERAALVTLERALADRSPIPDASVAVPDVRLTTTRKTTP